MSAVKTAAILAAIVAASGCAASAAATPRDEPTISATSIAVKAPVVTANAAAMGGHGGLAFVSAHTLYLLRGSELSKISLGGRATQPQWSHDGRWLAVSVSPAPPKNDPYKSEPVSFWLVSTAGKVERRLASCGFGSTGSWSPSADRFAVSCDRDTRSTAEVIGSRGAVTKLLSADELSGMAWSPDGLRIAVARNHFNKSHGWDDRIAVIAARGGAVRVVTKQTGSVLNLHGWWPDGSGILASLDYQGSGSLAADGLPLLDISAKTGVRRRLPGSMLQYPQWLSTSRLHDEVAYIAGGDRELTLGHKHVEVCSKKSCHSVKQPSGQVSFDPAWSATGRLALVRDKAIDPRHGFGMSYVRKTQASGVVALRFGAMLRTPIPGEHASDPVWGRSGGMLVVRNQMLWLLNSDLEGATKVAGPLQVPSNYYGFVPWQESFAWSEAAR